MRAFLGYVRHADGSASSLAARRRLIDIIRDKRNAEVALGCSFESLAQDASDALESSDTTVRLNDSRKGYVFVIESMTLKGTN